MVISLIFDVAKTRGSHFPISLIYMYSYGKIVFDLHVFGLRGTFRNAASCINENRLFTQFGG